MRSKSLQTDGASSISCEGTSHERKPRLKRRLFDEVIKFLAIAFYLWVMFGVFALQRLIPLSQVHQHIGVAGEI
jgi:hypothetical protein